MSPQGVPGPTRVSNSFCSAVSICSLLFIGFARSLLSRRKRDQTSAVRAGMSGKIRIGIVGMGAAGWAFVPAIRGNPAFELAAVAEPAAEMRETAAAETGVAVHSDLPSMLRSAALDAVYIATPTELHPEHVAEVCAAKKHVLTEKPMAIRVEQAQAMIEAAERAGVVLQVGHSHSYDLPIARMREIVASGALGRVRMIHTWNFTDWMARPRRAAELDVGQGGGVTYRQGAHQVDILRLIGGGLVKSVRATTFDWDESRRSIGAHTIYLNFADGAAATAVYNGYGHFSGAELIGGVGEWGEAARPRAEPQACRARSRRTGAGRQAQARPQCHSRRARRTSRISA